jgi:hypothetical protein
MTNEILSEEKLENIFDNAHANAMTLIKTE